MKQNAPLIVCNSDSERRPKQPTSRLSSRFNLVLSLVVSFFLQVPLSFFLFFHFVSCIKWYIDSIALQETAFHSFCLCAFWQVWHRPTRFYGWKAMNNCKFWTSKNILANDNWLSVLAGSEEKTLVSGQCVPALFMSLMIAWILKSMSGGPVQSST